MNTQTTHYQPTAYAFPTIASLKSSVSLAPATMERLSRVPVQKPTRKDFIRVRNESERMCPALGYEDKDDRAFYLIAPELVHLFGGDAAPVTLVEAINRQNVTFIWPLKVSTEGGSGTWQDSALMAADLAKTKWVRLAADMSLGAYRIFEAQGELSEPTWLDKPFQELLEIAFKDRFVDHEDHPVLKRLQGRV